MTAAGPAGPVSAPYPPAAPGAAPEPPRGPGVAPPFPAPPTEGRTARLWLGLGLGGLVLVLCCGVGAAATVGLVVTGGRAINEQAEVVIGDYLDALRDENYGGAYGMLCREAQDREDREQFVRRQQAEPAVTRYDVGNVNLTDLSVPVEVTYRSGDSETLRFHLEQDTGTGQLEVCRIEG